MHGKGIAWKVHGRCTASAWQLHGKCMAWQVHGKCLATAWQLHGKRLATPWPLRGSFLARIMQHSIIKVAVEDSSWFGRGREGESLGEALGGAPFAVHGALAITSGAGGQRRSREPLLDDVAQATSSSSRAPWLSQPPPRILWGPLRCLVFQVYSEATAIERSYSGERRERWCLVAHAETEATKVEP